MLVNIGVGQRVFDIMYVEFMVIVAAKRADRARDACTWCRDPGHHSAIPWGDIPACLKDTFHASGIAATQVNHDRNNTLEPIVATIG